MRADSLALQCRELQQTELKSLLATIAQALHTELLTCQQKNEAGEKLAPKVEEFQYRMALRI